MQINCKINVIVTHSCYWEKYVNKLHLLIKMLVIIKVTYLRLSDIHDKYIFT